MPGHEGWAFTAFTFQYVSDLRVFHPLGSPHSHKLSRIPKYSHHFAVDLANWTSLEGEDAKLTLFLPLSEPRPCPNFWLP